MKPQKVNPSTCLLTLLPWGNIPGCTWQWTGGMWSLGQPEIYHWWQYIGLVLSQFPGAPRSSFNGWICLHLVLFWMSYAQLRSFLPGIANGCQCSSAFLSLSALVPSCLPLPSQLSELLLFFMIERQTSFVLCVLIDRVLRQWAICVSLDIVWALSLSIRTHGHYWKVSCWCCGHDPYDPKEVGTTPLPSQSLDIRGSHPGVESWLAFQAVWTFSQLQNGRAFPRLRLNALPLQMWERKSDALKARLLHTISFK